MKKCPYCAEEIQDEAKFCRYCGRDLKQPSVLNAVGTIFIWLLLAGFLSILLIVTGNENLTFGASTIVLVIGLIINWKTTRVRNGFFVLFALSCVIPFLAILFFVASIPSSYETYSPSPTSTFVPYVTSPPQPRAPTATRNPCTQALLVTPYYDGQTICVYGNLQRQQFLTFNYTVRLYFSEAPGFFFLCENCYFPDLEPGDCISARGLIQLTTDKQPFINVTQQSLKNCN